MSFLDCRVICMVRVFYFKQPGSGISSSLSLLCLICAARSRASINLQWGKMYIYSTADIFSITNTKSPYDNLITMPRNQNWQNPIGH